MTRLPCIQKPIIFPHTWLNAWARNASFGNHLQINTHSRIWIRENIPRIFLYDMGKNFKNILSFSYISWAAPQYSLFHQMPLVIPQKQELYGQFIPFSIIKWGISVFIRSIHTIFSLAVRRYKRKHNNGSSCTFEEAKEKKVFPISFP